MDVVVEAVGFQLASANSSLCPNGWSSGFSIHTIEQYGSEYRDAARRFYGLGNHVGILSVVANSPADLAGVRFGDQLVSADRLDLPPPAHLSTDASFARTAKAQQIIARSLDDGVAQLELVRDGRHEEVTIRAVPACPSIFQLVPANDLNGEADGNYVQVSTEIVELAASPDELAALLAHELAHNILRHRHQLDRLKVNRGLLAPFGRNARLIRASEAEADRLSVWLMARAGYNPETAVRFWSRIRDSSGALGSDPTHPSWSERLQLMKAECARIAKPRGSAGNTQLPTDLRSKVDEARRPQGPDL